jgi:hypothetical protein
MPFFSSLFSPKKMPEKLGKIDIKTPRKWRNLRIEGGKLYKNFDKNIETFSDAIFGRKYRPFG